MASGRLPGDFWPRSASWTGPGAASGSECEGAFAREESEEEAKQDLGEDDGEGSDEVTEMKRPAARKDHVPTSMKRPAARKAAARKADDSKAVAKKRAKRNAKDAEKTETEDDPGLDEQPTMKKPSASTAASIAKPRKPHNAPQYR